MNKRQSKGILVFLTFFVLLNSLLFALTSGMISKWFFEDYYLNNYIDYSTYEITSGVQTYLSSNTITDSLNRFYVYIEFEDGSIFQNASAEVLDSKSNLLYDYSYSRNGIEEATYYGNTGMYPKGNANNSVKNSVTNYFFGNGIYEKDIVNLRLQLLNVTPSSEPAYSIYMNAILSQKYIFIASILLVIAVVVLLFLLTWGRKKMAIGNRTMAKFTHYFWLEWKLLLAYFLISIFRDTYGIFLFFNILAIFWSSYFAINELVFYKKDVLEHSFVYSCIHALVTIKSQARYQQQWTIRFILLVCIEIVLLLYAFNFLMNVPNVGLLLPLGIFVFGIWLIVLFYKMTMQYFNDMKSISNQIDEMAYGNFENELILPQNSVLYRTACNLNKFNQGMQIQIEEQVKSEKMKIDLITNVSHDLKTPITSLINYSELLLKEDIKNENVKEYIDIISKKSHRLKNLVQDLFEISKATSGNLTMFNEVVEVNELLKQTLAEFDEKIMSSSISFKVNYINDCYINVDGNRLYNVLSNVISNILKYSLDHSRAYIDIKKEKGYIYYILKNVSNYEMNFNAESLTERFVRGDVSRSTEGSGLGLAIVKSFVDLMHGTLNISVDGDLFKVEIGFEEVLPKQEVIEIPIEEKEE